MHSLYIVAYDDVVKNVNHYIMRHVNVRKKRERKKHFYHFRCCTKKNLRQLMKCSDVRREIDNKSLLCVYNIEMRARHSLTV